MNRGIPFIKVADCLEANIDFEATQAQWPKVRIRAIVRFAAETPERPRVLAAIRNDNTVRVRSPQQVPRSSRQARLFESDECGGGWHTAACEGTQSDILKVRNL
jgi:hypothetical protein